MKDFVSVVIPSYNSSPTIGRCLESVFSSVYKAFEVIVVDDCSEDNSAEIIRRFPCRLIRLERHSGAAKARNAGAAVCRGGIIFFIDSDCILPDDTLSKAASFTLGKGPSVIVGGTYMNEPADDNFFSRFQAVFINYSETKDIYEPDYIATHAMVIHAGSFRDGVGFTEPDIPILEDVEFSHRMREKGYRLLINPEILVSHIFNYNLFRSLSNAFRKSMYWTVYSIKKRDIFADSGTASHELKANVALFFASLLLLAAGIVSRFFVLHSLLPALLTINVVINRRLIAAFSEAGGIWFGFAASFYYFFIYPLAVGSGVAAGLIRRLFR